MTKFNEHQVINKREYIVKTLTLYFYDLLTISSIEDTFIREVFSNIDVFASELLENLKELIFQIYTYIQCS